MLRASILLCVSGGLLLGPTPAPVSAQSVASTYTKVTRSVVVVRAAGRDLSAVTPGLAEYHDVGSGVLVSTEGHIMTAAHLVNAKDEITVEILGKPAVPARLIASEPSADLALLKVDQLPGGWTPARLANSDGVKIGEQVMVIGAPYGLSHSLSVGWISARRAPNTVHRAMPLAEFFQTDAGINAGNSGGPVFNMGGEVIGIVSHNISQSGGSEGVGFVVTINTARMLLQGRRSFWSGLEGEIISGDIVSMLNVPQPTAYLVKTVGKGSPGAALGLQGARKVVTIDRRELAVGGDVILSVEDVPLGKAEDHERLRKLLEAKPAGAPYSMRVLRAGRILDLVGRLP